MATKKGRKRFRPDPTKVVETLDDKERELLRRVLAEPAVAADLDGARLHVQEERLRLAQQLCTRWLKSEARSRGRRSAL